MRLLGVSERDAGKLLRGLAWDVQEDRAEEGERPDVLALPPGSAPLQDSPRGCAYCVRRGFDPVALGKLWGLRVTGPGGPYALRLIAPIYLDGRLVSYQGRDITGKAASRYKACSKENEVVHHKDTLYGVDLVPGDRAVVTEGVTKVWRLGPGSVATFGAEWTSAQAAMLARRFRSVLVAFDGDEAGWRKGRELAEALGLLGVETASIVWTTGIKDPGDLPQEDADALMREVLR
jgi:hypothetical protein